MDIPVVLIHKTENKCLEFSLRSTKEHNQDVTLITDIVSGKYNHLAKIVDIYQLKSEQIDTLTKVYKHLSTNKQEFEFICIQRWFLLLEHMRKNSLSEVIYIDSDIIVYENLTDIVRNFYSEYDMCLCTPKQSHEAMDWVSSGGTMYCTYQSLEALCNSIIETYKNNMNELLIKWNWHLETNYAGGINDMTLIYLFQRNTTMKIGNFLSVADNTFCIDAGFAMAINEFPDEYEMEKSFILDYKIKKMVFKNKQPYGYNKIIKKPIRFVLLHFQSNSKNIMQLYMKDNRYLKTLLSDYMLTIRMTYYAIRREMRKIKK